MHVLLQIKLAVIIFAIEVGLVWYATKKVKAYFQRLSVRLEQPNTTVIEGLQKATSVTEEVVAELRSSLERLDESDAE